MERAFQRILKIYKPSHPIALVSLCTTTRPYSAGRKWKTLKKQFGGVADLVISSNGGMIPIVYESCFPYLNYDAHGEPEFDDEYVKVMKRRMREFFTACRYDYIMFLFRPNLRNVRAASVVGPWLVEKGYTKEYAILPTEKQYEAVAAAGAFGSTKYETEHAGYSMFPELHPVLLQPVQKKIDQWVEASGHRGGTLIWD
jgi:hypothetical protein